MTDQLEAYGKQGGVFESRARREKRIHEEAEALIVQNAEMSNLVEELRAITGQGEQIARTFEILDQHLPKEFHLSGLESGWDVDPDLGIGRGNDKPILQIQGGAREGIQSEATLYDRMVQSLREGLPGVALNGGYKDRKFSVDLTMFAPRAEEPTDEDDERGEG